MPDEEKIEVPQEPQPTPAEETAQPPEAPKVVPFDEWIASATPDEIMRHPKIAGIHGQRLQSERERVKREEQERRDREAYDKAQREMEELANTDPEEFAKKYLSTKEQEKIRQNQKLARDEIQKKYAEEIGRTLRVLTNGEELSPEEFNRLQAAMTGKADEEAIGAFNAVAVDIIADRKLAKSMAKYRNEEMAKEREAIRAELAAEKLQNSERPDMARGTSPKPFDPTQLPPAEFSKWYAENVLNR